MRYDLPDMGEPPSVLAEGVGVPRLLSIADIDEDPAQPRQEFDAEALHELAATIGVRGVRQPVSVRSHPDQPGRWMLNFGARRLRASKLAGKLEIPAFIDTPFDSYDQVIENEQREALRPLELALFMERRLAAGETRAEIARGLGKSRGYLTFIGALIDPPDWLLELYRSGRCTAINELYELRRLHETHPAAVEQWSGEQENISRENVYRLKNALACKTSTDVSIPSTLSDRASTASTSSAAAEASTPLTPPLTARTARSSTTAVKSAVLWGRYRGTDVAIDLSSIPEEDGFVFVTQGIGGQSLCASACDLQLVRVTPSRR